MKGNMIIALVAIYMFVIELLTATAAFYAITIWTQLPVDNNSLWIGLCIMVTVASSTIMAGAAISITSVKK